MLLAVQNNQLSGAIPAEWSRRAAFGSQPITLFIKPGNDRLCGPIPPGVAALDADLNSSFSVQPVMVMSEGGMSARGAPMGGAGATGGGGGGEDGAMGGGRGSSVRVGGEMAASVGGEGTPSLGVLVSVEVAQVQLPSC